MELKEARYILAIAKHKSIGKAAESLFISQPSLSRYIKDLENRLGVQLFQRINNRLILTHAGEKYVETAKKITEMYTDLEKDLSGINEELSGRLRVGCAVLRMSYNMPSTSSPLSPNTPTWTYSSTRTIPPRGWNTCC